MKALSSIALETRTKTDIPRHVRSTLDQLPSSLLDCVGNTPLINLNQIRTRSDIAVLGKLEMQNPGGSIKDRTAVSMLRNGIREGMITPKTKIVESSSGNLGIGLALACRQLGLSLTIVVDSRTNRNVVKLVKLYGASIEVVSETREGESLLDARLRRVRELESSDPEVYWVNQYENPANPAAHRSTMGEIVRQTRGRFDRLYIATSTCGTLSGCREYLDRSGLHPHLEAVDAAGSAIFQTREKAAQCDRHLPGHGSSQRSHFLKPEHVDGVSHISDRECVSGCRFLLQQEGILAGGSSGGVVSAFRRDEPFLESGTVVVLLLCDRGERYLDTIYNDDWVNQTLKSG